MEDILKAPPGCLLLVTSYEAKLIDCDEPLGKLVCSVKNAIDENAMSQKEKGPP